MKLINPNNKTQFCLSLAAYPGNTGAKLHNTAYKILNLNYIYLPIRCTSNFKATNILKNLEFKGCSLSMPFKQSLTKKLDTLDKIAKKTGSINTILKKRGKLYGFNTDYYALNRVFKEKEIDLKKMSVLLLGNGGVAKTSFELLKSLKVKKIFLSSRNLKRYSKWKIFKNVEIIKWTKRNNLRTDILINATPIGMLGNKIKSPLDISSIKKFKLIVDFTVNKKKNLLERSAKKFKIDFISGIKISFYQGIKQFKIYTGRNINEKKLIKNMSK